MTPVVHQSYFLKKKKKVPSHGKSGIAIRLTLLLFFLLTGSFVVVVV